MYVFIKLTVPMQGSDCLYEYTVDNSWLEVENEDGIIVYAYVDSDSNMCVLELDETSPALTTQITMKNISNAEYAGIDDINISADSYVIGIDGVSTTPAEAWQACKNTINP